MGPTWVRRGTQGHVADSRRPTRAPAWRGGDTWAIFIFIIYIGFLIYIGLPIIGRQIINPTNSSLLIYPIVSFHFYSVGLCSTHFVLIAGYVDQG